MKIFCTICKKNAANKHCRVRRAKENRLMLISNYFVCGKENLGFIKNQETSGLLSKLEIRTSLRNIPLTNDILL